MLLLLLHPLNLTMWDLYMAWKPDGVQDTYPCARFGGRYLFVVLSHCSGKPILYMPEVLSPIMF